MGIKGFEFPLSGRARVLSSAISKEALASRRGSNNVSDSQEYGASMHKLEGPWYLFLPESRCRIFLDMLVVIAFFLTFILLPVQVVYCSTQADQKIVHSLIGSIFAANILSTFFTCYEDDTLRRLMPEEYKLLRADLLVTSLKKLSKSYIRSWFFLDIVAVVPCLLLDLGVFYPSLTCNSGFRYLALLKSLTIFQYLRSTDRIKEFNEGWFKRIRSFFIDNDLHALQRIAWLYFMFLVFNHYTGLIFLFIAQKEDKEDNWIGDDVAEDSASYVQSMYWALATSLTVGYGDVSPVTMNEKVYTMIVFMLGFLIHTAITGAVTVMFTEWDASHAKFMKEIAIITQFFKKYKHHLSRTLRSRVLRYYDYNWQHHGDRHLERMAEILPYHLMRDVKMAILHEMVSNCPLFKNCAEDFVCKLVMDLNPVSLLLGDSIFQEGDIGRELYFVHIGSMAVLVEELQVAVLKTGDYFGEVALLRTSAKRSATVKALTNSQLFVMPKDLLKDVLSYSPDIVSKLEKAAKNKLKSDSRRNMLKIKTIMAVRKSVPRMLSGGAGALSGLMQSDETRLEGLRTLRLCSVASNHSNSYLEEDKDQALEKCQAQDKDSSKAGRLLLHRFRQMSRSKSRSKNNSMSISREDASTTISNEDSLKNKEDEIQACSHTHNCSRRDSDRAPNQDGPSLHWNPASSTDNLLQNDTICGKESTCCSTLQVPDFLKMKRNLDSVEFGLGTPKPWRSYHEQGGNIGIIKFEILDRRNSFSLRVIESWYFEHRYCKVKIICWTI